MSALQTLQVLDISTYAQLKHELIVLSKQVGSRFVQMVSKIQDW